MPALRLKIVFLVFAALSAIVAARGLYPLGAAEDQPGEELPTRRRNGKGGGGGNKLAAMAKELKQLKKEHEWLMTEFKKLKKFIEHHHPSEGDDDDHDDEEEGGGGKGGKGGKGSKDPEVKACQEGQQNGERCELDQKVGRCIKAEGGEKKCIIWEDDMTGHAEGVKMNYMPAGSEKKQLKACEEPSEDDPCDYYPGYGADRVKGVCYQCTEDEYENPDVYCANHNEEDEPWDYYLWCKPNAGGNGHAPKPMPTAPPSTPMPTAPPTTPGGGLEDVTQTTTSTTTAEDRPFRPE